MICFRTGLLPAAVKFPDINLKELLQIYDGLVCSL